MGRGGASNKEKAAVREPSKITKAINNLKLKRAIIELIS